ncbi:MAG: DUF2878 domain-containing protein [Planctomycetota bacterium]|jgi:hypothetical protein
MSAFVVNLVGFQVGWFACILGAAAGRPAVGPLVVAGLVIGQYAAARRHMPAPVVLAAAAAIGYAADSALVLAGRLEFPPETHLLGPSPLWMAAMWVNLAVTLRGALGWLSGRLVACAVLGAVSGPLAYEAGARLGAVGIGAPAALSHALIAVEWLVGLPLLVLLADLADRRRAPREATA